MRGEEEEVRRRRSGGGGKEMLYVMSVHSRGLGC